MFRKAETTILQFLVMFIVGVVIFFTASPIFASYMNMNSRSAQDLDRMLETIESLSGGDFRSITLHNMDSGTDFLIFMNRSGPVDLRLYSSSDFENNPGRYDRVIEFHPDDNVCIDGESCICIFQGANLQSADDNNVVRPRSVACRSMNEIFISGGINIITSFGNEFELQDLQGTLTEAGTTTPLESAVAGVAGGGAITSAVAVGAFKVVGLTIGAGIMSTIGLPVLIVGGVASAVMYNGVAELARTTGYNGFLVTRENYDIEDPDVLIITNSDENFRSMQIYVQKFGEDDDKIVVCPMIQLCNDVVSAAERIRAISNLNMDSSAWLNTITEQAIIQ